MGNRDEWPGGEGDLDYTHTSRAEPQFLSFWEYLILQLAGNLITYKEMKQSQELQTKAAMIAIVDGRVKAQVLSLLGLGRRP